MNAQLAPELPVTVNMILERFEREYMPRELAPRTRRDYTRHVAKLKAIFGDRIAADLKPKDFGPFLQAQGRGRVQRVRQLQCCQPPSRRPSPTGSGSITTCCAM